MSNILNALKGKKTYIVAGITFTLGGLQAIGYPVPDYVYALLGATGLTTLRSGLFKL